ncbi:MAG: cation diffusion facilitator family transporter [Spirochaetota bacterium]|jgi:cation diffusion facilitator family transporter|nr:cation diffusion facilitator family transporter [Spirochaetota bacterium]
MDKVQGGYVEGIVSIIINTILAAAKFWVGAITGSLAMIADGWHTLSDSISSVILVIAAKLMSKKADREHPFGHGRWEQIAALFMAFLLGIIGYDFLKQAVEKFGKSEGEPVVFGSLALAIMIISVLVKEGLAQYAFYIARATDNEAVKADGWHHRSDAIASLLVVLGILFVQDYWWLDAALAAIVALFLFYAAWEIIQETVTKMLGEKPNDELIQKITARITSTHPEALQLHHFHLHDYVTQKELTLHIRLPRDMTIEKSHEIASEIEDMIAGNFGISATIHVEPLP